MKINKRIPVIILILAALLTAGMVVRLRVKLAATSGPSDEATMPLTFARLHPGMSEDAVVAAVGEPNSRRVNPKYVQKSAADWAKLADSLDSRSQTDPTNRGTIRLELQLEHRIKNIWRYTPSKLIYADISFDDCNKVIRLDSGLLGAVARHVN